MVTLNQMDDMIMEACNNLMSLGYDVGNIVDLKISSRYRRAWAKCYMKPNRQFVIGLSSELLKAPTSSVRDVIYHEVIHTCKGCFNHGINFKRAMDKCNIKFGTNIHLKATVEQVMNGVNVA